MSPVGRGCHSIGAAGKQVDQVLGSWGDARLPHDATVFVHRIWGYGRAGLWGQSRPGTLYLVDPAPSPCILSASRSTRHNEDKARVETCRSTACNFSLKYFDNSIYYSISLVFSLLVVMSECALYHQMLRCVLLHFLHALALNIAATSSKHHGKYGKPICTQHLILIGLSSHRTLIVERSCPESPMFASRSDMSAICPVILRSKTRQKISIIRFMHHDLFPFPFLHPKLFCEKTKEP